MDNKPRRAEAKYYVYVSDAKVDMLFSQIPRRLLERIAGELRIDLKLVAISLRQNPAEENRYSRTRIVSEYLEAHQEVGEIDAPKSYFRGSLPMRWGVFGDEPNRVVFFGGYAGMTLVGLTGSPRHVIGQPGDAALRSDMSSYGITTYDGLSKHLNLPESELGDHSSLEGALWATEQFGARLYGSHEQSLEFLAKRLASASEAEGNVMYDPPGRPPHDVTLLGSPIYVAMAD